MIGFIRVGKAASTYPMPHGDWRFLVTNADTERAWSLAEVELAPGTVGAEPHWHAQGSEAIYVLAGTLEVVLEGETRRLTPGDVLVVPPGYLHSFRNPSDQPVRALMFCLSLEMEDYCSNSAEIADRAEYDRRHDIYPPPSAIARAAGSI